MQNIVFAMCSRPAPPVANIFMAEIIDEAILKIAQKYGDKALRVMKRFLNDLFPIFTAV